MARTKELIFYSYGAYKSAGAATQYSDNILSKVGYETGAISYTYVTGYKPAYKLLDEISDTAQISSLTITIKLESSGGAHTVYAGELSGELMMWEHQSNYNRIMSVPATWTLATGKTHTLTVTDAEQIRKILTYGVGVRPATSGNWTATVLVNVQYTYTDPYEAPEIAFTSAPSSAYLRDGLPLTWSYAQAGNAAQYAIDVQITDAAGKTVNAASKYVTSAHSYTVALSALNIAAGDAVVRVRAYIQSGSIAGAWIETTVTLRNIAVEIVAPKGGENKLAAQSMRMQWKKAASDTSVNDPYAFTVQYSTNAGETWTALLTKGSATKESGVWYVTVPANTFPHGIVQWRVLAWTTQYQYGDYARDNFSSVIQASTAAVSCDGKPLPTLSWSSSSQAAYQVRFADYDSGAVYSSAKSHTVPYVYADGLYAVQVRTQATTGEWSAWTDVQYVQITNSAPSGSVSVSAQKTKHAVTLTWTVSGTFAGYILYRSGVPVYAGKDKKFADITANGRHTYFVRAVTAAGYYLQSAEITVNTTPDVDCLYDFAGARWISLKYSATPRRRQYTETERVSYRYFAGRAYPVAFTEGFRERTGAFSYCFTTEADAAAVAALAGRTVMYKGKDGSGIYGILGGVSRVSEIIHDVSFTVTQIDREERVPYETA